MKAYWDALEGRDRQLLVVLLSTVLVAACYWLIWQPLQDDLANTQRKIKVQENTLAQVKVIGQKIMTLQGGDVTKKTPGDLNHLINSSAQQSKIAISRLQAKDQTVLVWIDEVNFNQFLSWLEALNQRYGIEVHNIDISATDKKGMIQVRRLMLGRG